MSNINSDQIDDYHTGERCYCPKCNEYYSDPRNEPVSHSELEAMDREIESLIEIEGLLERINKAQLSGDQETIDRARARLEIIQEEMT